MRNGVCYLRSVMDSKGRGCGGGSHPCLLALAIFPQAPFSYIQHLRSLQNFDVRIGSIGHKLTTYSLAYTLAVGTASVMCKYPRTLGDHQAADSITAALYQQPRPAGISCSRRKSEEV